MINWLSRLGGENPGLSGLMAHGMENALIEKVSALL